MYCMGGQRSIKPRVLSPVMMHCSDLLTSVVTTSNILTLGTIRLFCWWKKGYFIDSIILNFSSQEKISCSFISCCLSARADSQYAKKNRNPTSLVWSFSVLFVQTSHPSAQNASEKQVNKGFRAVRANKTSVWWIEWHRSGLTWIPAGMS